MKCPDCDREMIAKNGADHSDGAMYCTYCDATWTPVEENEE